MLHLLYILAFTIIAFLAISNLIRSLITLSTESQRHYAPRSSFAKSSSRTVPHPELLDDRGQPVSEPLLVMRSVNVDDAREKLDAIFNASPNTPSEQDEKN